MISTAGEEDEASGFQVKPKNLCNSNFQLPKLSVVFIKKITRFNG